ncbi:CutC family protein [Apiospora saccharicola]|uniref:Copper homeostasis protein cutC homolog n=1 Tax=Apiospora saccharicola TaxID=335842 RepID=A0ABR1UZC5_9PEZI
MPTRLEIPVFGPASAFPAIAAGAARIELNAEGSYPAGGLTPSIEDAAQLRDVKVPVRVMIRPRGPPAGPQEGQRDFLYSEAEIDGMVRSIEVFKASGTMRVGRGDGFVFGALATTEAEGNGRIVLQTGTVKRLVAAARPFKTVFHRAFDDIVGCDGANSSNDEAPEVVAEWENALASLVQMGVHGILTSGGPGNAAQNSAALSKIIAKAGQSIEIIPGGGVRSSNVRELCAQLDIGRQKVGKISWVHSSCLTGGKDDVDVAEVQKILGEIKQA